MSTRLLLPVSSTVLLLAWPASAQYTFATIDVHCAASAEAQTCPSGLSPGQVATQTSARGINAQGHVVGFYIAGGRQRGFVLENGRFASLEFPLPGVRATIANGINARGEIVGQYTAPVHDPANPPAEDSPLHCPGLGDPACIKGFHHWNGTFTTVLFPATVDEHGNTRLHPGAIAQRITPDGDIYGCLHGHDMGPSMFGAAWTRSGTFSLTYNGGHVSDATAVPMTMHNGATPNAQRTIVGLITDMSNVQHGYLVRGGQFEMYDATSDANLTAIWDINVHGQFVGTYRLTGEPVTRRHGFLHSPGAPQSVTVDFTCDDPAGCGGMPMGTVAFATIAFGINANGVIVGHYVPAAGGVPHGFIATPHSRAF